MDATDRSIKPYRIVRMNLGTAASVQRYHLQGHHLRVRDTSSPDVAVLVHINDPQGEPIPLTKGQGWQHLAFWELYFTWSAQADAWMDIEIYGSPLEAAPDRFGTFVPQAMSDVVVRGDVSVTDGLEVTLTSLPTAAALDDGRIYVPISASTKLKTYTTIYTVGADVLLFIERIALSNTSNAGETWLEILDDEATTIHEFKNTMPGDNGQVFIMPNPIALATDYLIKLKATKGKAYATLQAFTLPVEEE